MAMSNTLELVDLDGTTNTLDLQASLDEREGEIFHYFVGAAQHIADFLNGDDNLIDVSDIFEGIKVASISVIFPERAHLKNWGTFPNSEKVQVPVTPAVDHMQVLKPAAAHYLRDLQSGLSPGELLYQRIDQFFARDWGFGLFKAGSSASLPHTNMEEDAITALDRALVNERLITIFTNSAPEKAAAMLGRAGFEDRIVKDRVEKGKIGAIGWAKKWLINTDLPSDSVDLSEYYPDQISLDLRRGVYHDRVTELMESTGADRVAMYTDIPELDLYPLWRWFGDRARLAMKTNPMSAPESIAAAEGIMQADVSDRLSDLMAA